MTPALLIAGLITFAPPQGAENLLKVGTLAPDFTLKTPAGTPLKFSSVYKKNKATILNFWFYH